ELSWSEGSKRLFRRHRTRYGGYVVHLGVALAAVSITASMAHKVEREFTLKVGESFDIGRFKLKLESVEPQENENYLADIANITVLSRTSGEKIADMKPEKRLYIKKQEPTTEVALRITPREDLYIAFAGIDPETERVSFKVFINPLQMWLWVGGAIILFGTGIVLVPEKRRSRVLVTNSVAGEVV
ncbi:MAG: hypothetical protein KDD53_11040, partial [Bdellovibrionales bacterium]|nr:hypothetical protein [Bdellovibrionales bacterium]